MRRNKRQLKKICTKSNTKELWRAVRHLIGREHEPAVDPSITADSLNRHYASVSTAAAAEAHGHRAPEFDTLRDGLRSIQDAGYTAADSNRTRQATGLVSQARSTGLPRSSRRPD